jgi:hypothetical protein
MGRPVDMSPEAILARIREVSRVSDLTAETRLDAKLDMSPEGILARLREVSELLDLCERLAETRKP